MVELSRTFSFNEQILPQIRKYRDQYSSGEADIVSDLETIKSQINAHIVGQERDSTVLVTWNDKSPRSSGTGGHKVSYVAAYEPTRKQFKVLFIHDKKVEITGASVNQERTLLAFTTIEPYFGSYDDTGGSERPGVYKSFLAEICPLNRIFYLYIERHTYQRVQFLYGDYLGYRSSSKKESHMLFFHHKEVIGLYHIPMARIVDKGMILSNQPRTESVGDAFLWTQWDTLNQRLYYIYKKYKDPDEVDQGKTEHELMFAAFQFIERTSHVQVLNMPLPFDIKLEDIDSSSPKYLNLPMTQTISEKHFNMQVVTTQGGSLYICLQHPLPKDRPEPQNAEKESDTSADAREMTALEYSVYLLHHDCMIHCVLRSVVPADLVSNCLLFFSSFNDYLMVLLPGYALHLLNGSAEHELCHHIILQDDAIPRFSVQEPYGQPPVLLYLYREQSTSVQTVPNILDSRSGDGFQCSFNKQCLVDIFSRTHLAATRLALLHLVLVHLRDSSLVKKMVQHLCYDPSSPECSELLREYLIGSTYGLLKRQLDKEVLKLLPFTCVDTFRGHLEESLDKRRIARISCTLRRNTRAQFQISKSDKMKEMEFWSALKSNNNNAKRPSARFSLKSLPLLTDDDSDEEVEKCAMENNALMRLQNTQESTQTFTYAVRGQFPTSVEQSILCKPNISSQKLSKPSKAEGPSQQQIGAVRTLWRRLSIRKYPSSESLTSQGSTRSADFLEATEEKETKFDIKKKSMVIEKLALYLQAHLPKETKSKTQNIAAEFVKCQSRQSELLLRLFWSGLEFTSDTNPTTTLLSVRGTVREVAFFQMVERYYTTVTDLNFPFPPGFQTFFTTLAFRCLDPRMFLQYVDNDVLQLTDHFIYRLVEDCGAKGDNAGFVFQIISRLKHERAKNAMRRWDHPLCTRYMSQHFVDDLLSQESLVGERDPLDSLFVPPKDGMCAPSTLSSFSSAGSSMENEPADFRPLATLMSALKARAVQLSTVEGRRMQSSPIDINSVGEFALRETSRQVNGNLGTVPF